MNPDQDGRRTTAMRCTVIVMLAALVAPVLCAQERGFVRGLGGVTLGGAETGMAGGAGFGVRISRYLDIFAEAGMFEDVRTQELQNDLATLSTFAVEEFSVTLDLNKPIPCQYGFFGSRVNMPTGSVVSPFVEIGGGGGRLDIPSPDFIPSFVLTYMVDQRIDRYKNTHPLLAAGAGIHLAATRKLGFDVGYRYQRIFTDEPAIATNLVYVALLFRF